VQLFAIADDLTGALEVGAKFAEHGISAQVIVRAAALSAAPVSVIDTETRHLTPAAAARTVRGAAALAADDALVFKKTDSTLRGNIGAEFEGLLTAFPGAGILYVPAYPEMGRSVRGGRLFVHGTPVHETDFAADPLDPVKESDIRRLLTQQFTARGLLDNVRIVDGETAADIDAAATEALAAETRLIVAGPAAIAGALARKMALPHGGPRPPQPAITRCLVINGSLNPRSLEQIQYAMAAGWPAIEPNCEAPAAGWFVFRLNLDGSKRGLERAATLGRAVAETVHEWALDALMVVGGDTAYGIHAALGHPLFDSWGEVAPGVSLSHVRLPEGHRLSFITKAGGFGPPEILCDIRRRLQ
jgi:uncharacterized protein YgbK (DUF1537 family)